MTAEINSQSAFATARGLGKLAGYMANKGTMNGKQFMSEEAWNDMHSEPKGEFILPFANSSHFTKGGVCLFDLELADKIEPLPYYTSNPIWKHLNY